MSKKQLQAERRVNKVLCAMIALVIVFLLVSQLVIRVRIGVQNRRTSAVVQEIGRINANIGNLELNLDQRHDTDYIRSCAVALGMVQESETEVRRVHMGDTMVVSNVTAD
ncbi:MAG: FAM174 family membrane protein [Clostridia bacterium]|nr:FAM174 family membrane protein [Clostridia bacterium]